MHKESVWDYPRPPRLEATSKTVQVVFNREVIASTTRAYRVLETSHPPVYYIPWDDVLPDALIRSPHRTFCEFKGTAMYWTVRVGKKSSENAAWSYEHPAPGYDDIRNCVAFYPAKMDKCTVDGEIVIPQSSSFYGGWVTAETEGLR